MSKRGENIYKRKDGRWEGRYVKCRTLHGKIQYGYIYGKSYSETKAKLKEASAIPCQTFNRQFPSPVLYCEILDLWLLSAKNRVKESTFSRYNHLDLCLPVQMNFLEVAAGDKCFRHNTCFVYMECGR